VESVDDLDRARGPESTDTGWTLIATLVRGTSLQASDNDDPIDLHSFSKRQGDCIRAVTDPRRHLLCLD